MEKVERVVFYPTRAIGDLVFKHLEGLGFTKYHRYPTFFKEHKAKFYYCTIPLDNEIWGGGENTKPTGREEVSLDDIFTGKVLPYVDYNFMDAKEVRDRLAVGADPLDLSIEKWERIVDAGLDGIKADIGFKQCALCASVGRITFSSDTLCDDCPIYKKTGEGTCIDTPYIKANEYKIDDHPSQFAEAAVEELEFLKSLREPERTYRQGDRFFLGGIELLLAFGGRPCQRVLIYLGSGCYRGDVVYVEDCNAITKEEIQKMMGTSLLDWEFIDPSKS